MDLLEINALGCGILRPGAFFLALDQKVDGFRGLFSLGRRIRRQLFVERAPADARKAEAEHEDNAYEQNAEGVQRALSLDR